MELRGENNGIYTSRNSLRLFNTFILTMAVIIYTSRNSLRLFNTFILTMAVIIYTSRNSLRLFNYTFCTFDKFQSTLVEIL